MYAGPGVQISQAEELTCVLRDHRQQTLLVATVEISGSRKGREASGGNLSLLLVRRIR